MQAIKHASMNLNMFYSKHKKEDDDEYCNLTNCLYDLFKLIKDHGKVKQGEYPIYNLVLRDGDFNNLLILLQEQGYEPPISHVCCKVPNLKIKIDKLKLTIRTQHLIKNGW